MYVADRMSRPVITIYPAMKIREAAKLMQREKIRRLPVVDRHDWLVGIVTERDLLHASPSRATSLSVWEINYLVEKITVREVMTREVITVDEMMPIEDAACIMAERKIGGLPVLREGRIVGIVSETDMFNIMLEMLGACEPGIRITASIPNKAGELADLTRSVFEIGGNILALGTMRAENPDQREILLKVSGASAEQLRMALKPWVEEIIDVAVPA